MSMKFVTTEMWQPCYFRSVMKLAKRNKKHQKTSNLNTAFTKRFTALKTQVQIS